ncbi:unnamed protein product, partial [Rotaria sordida]
NIFNMDDNNDIDKIQIKIQIITKFLNELKDIEDNLQQKSTQSLIEICQYLAIDNPIILWLPNRIKCENYVDLYIHLICTRSKLQEKKFNIEKQQIKLWNENLNSHEQQDQLENHFYQYLNLQYDKQNMNEINTWKITSESNFDLKNQHYLHHIDSSVNQQGSKSEDFSENDIKYISLMTLNLKSVPCTSSIFFQQIHKYREEPSIKSIISNKAQKFTIIHPNGESKTYLWKNENFCEKLQILFNEKKYDHDLFVVVNKNEIFIDFTKNNYRSSSDPSLLEYYIIEKQYLIQIQIHFRSNISEYFTTSKCKISTIIHHFIDEKQLESLSSDRILCFFDEFGKCIDDGIINDLCKTHHKTVSIFVTEEISNANILYELALHYNEDQNQMMSLFYSTTKWQQINLWLKTLLHIIDPSVDDYMFLIREKKTILDNDQSILSTFDQTESMIIDIINRNIVTKVQFTFETNNYSIYALKSTKISSLLNNENIFKYLNLTDLSFDDCFLVVKGSNEHILTKEDLQKSIDTYSITENEPIHFQIMTLVQITKYDDEEQIKVPLLNRNITIEELLHLTEKSMDVYKYLATNDTKRILDSNEKLSNLNKTKFILIKENEMCLVLIKKSNDLQPIHVTEEENEKYQRFIVCATIADVNKENQQDILHQYLLYSNDIVPSTDIQLITFQSESLIQFISIDQNLPITVTIKNTEVNKSIQFNCRLSITIKRLYEIACQLFCLKREYYCLIMNETTLDDDDVCLEDIDENMTEVQFKIISKASIHCSIMYDNQTVILTCHKDTIIMIIVKETMEKLHISEDNINMYELIALDDDQTQIDFDLSVDDILGSFSTGLTTISFELKKKNI